MTDSAAIVVANGKARRGTLVQIQLGGECKKGKVTDIDFAANKVQITTDAGEVLSAAAAEVQRQNPEPTVKLLPPARVSSKEPEPMKKQECKECHGQGRRRSLMGIHWAAGKTKPCKYCDGKGFAA